MGARFWFYRGAAIIIVGLVSLLVAETTATNRAVERLNSAAATARSNQLQTYLAKQTDPHKLVRLARALVATDQITDAQAVIDKAYELEPNSPTITLLASQFHPQLKKRVQELNPLGEATP